jgi:hypothetical protein
MSESERDRPLRSRSTADLVILILAFFVGVTVVLTAISLLVVELVRPEAQTAQGVNALSGVLTGAINVILGAVAGFIAGRGSRERRAPLPSSSNE